MIECKSFYVTYKAVMVEEILIFNELTVGYISTVWRARDEKMMLKLYDGVCKIYADFLQYMEPHDRVA